jgi:Spy/CpxP family protein refolding chaperone
MSRIRRYSVPALVLAVTLTASAALLHSALAQSSATPTPGAFGGHRLQWLQKKLGLSDDQVQQIQAVYANDQSQRQQLRSQLKQAFADFRQSALNGNADDSNLKTLSGQMLDLKGKELQQIGAILSPDQRTAFAAMKGHHHWHHARGFSGSSSPNAAATPDGSASSGS